jgi:hypothetical protein
VCIYTHYTVSFRKAVQKYDIAVSLRPLFWFLTRQGTQTKENNAMEHNSYKKVIYLIKKVDTFIKPESIRVVQVKHRHGSWNVFNMYLTTTTTPQWQHTDVSTRQATGTDNHCLGSCPNAAQFSLYPPQRRTGVAGSTTVPLPHELGISQARSRSILQCNAIQERQPLKWEKYTLSCHNPQGHNRNKQIFLNANKWDILSLRMLRP